jgi:hypothetical protein
VHIQSLDTIPANAVDHRRALFLQPGEPCQSSWSVASRMHPGCFPPRRQHAHLHVCLSSINLQVQLMRSPQLLRQALYAAQLRPCCLTAASCHSM